MDKYLTIWSKMQPDTWVTAKELGVAPASMTAMARRNLVAAKDTTPKQYCPIKNPTISILMLVEQHSADMTNYISIHRAGEELSMLCSIKNGKIFDCWDNEYDVSVADKVRIGKSWYSL